ncbi:alcohol dehydrogenase, putative [Talaromyces stipitatus ATCC 10500]|uniref:Alcohol dehydrogenase, putative n=1 Tax=Talaromyces stipitatus (strain ATCC 10500 / CBS 375.48 / QM 6759 / NRRL 1006) TaxID=441959 RepID=B8M7Q6_TALSN|nr:alcohol dehydrogenase, putative [Talaromyces stipitatus ATCC 10500]EED19785.1 alcohol dehydrogenase, putative [Talaromyces stipitatus ATCC 10500]
MSLPKTFRQAVFKESGGPLVIEDANLNPPAQGEILVKVEACGVCYSDTIAQHNWMGGGFPQVPGHEIIGEVAAVGSGVSGWAVGDRIGGGWHGGHDGTCKACKTGHYQMCDNQLINGVTKVGGYAEYCILRSEAAVRIPPDVDASEYAPMLCAGVTVFNSMRHMQIPPGSTVAIQGLGGLGHLALQYANKFGYRVVALSRDNKKEKFARQLGAHEYIDGSKEDIGQALQRLGGASLIVSTAPDKDSITPLLSGLGIRGKLLILSVVDGLPVNSAILMRRGSSIHSWPSGHAMDSEEAIQFAGLQDIKCMVETFPLEKANEAYGAMLNGSVRFRSVIKMT